MIKNELFCAAKIKANNPDGEFGLFSWESTALMSYLGSFERWSDANLDILQLASRPACTIEVSNILGKYLQWDRAPRRPSLQLPAMSRESKEITDTAGHTKPGAWRGSVKLRGVSLQTSSNRGHHLIQQKCESL